MSQAKIFRKKSYCRTFLTFGQGFEENVQLPGLELQLWPLVTFQDGRPTLSGSVQQKRTDIRGMDPSGQLLDESMVNRPSLTKQVWEEIRATT